MESLPHELVEDILGYCVASSPKNAVTPLRLVCRTFDHILKPIVCRTLNLDFTKLSKRIGKRPHVEGLQTIGYNAKHFYIDLMTLRDETEVDFLQDMFFNAGVMGDFIDSLRKNYTMNASTLTTWDYYGMVEAMLFNCRDVEALRLNLPFQIVGRYTNATTLILANTFKAFAKRPPEDSVPLRRLVLESVTDVAICRLWMNPTDVQNILATTSKLKNLVITLRRQDEDTSRAGFFGSCFWSVVESAEELESFCLVGLEMDKKPRKVFKRTFSSQSLFNHWFVRAMPEPQMLLPSLTRLELKRIEIHGEFLARAVENCNALEELYLSEIYLKTEGTETSGSTPSKYLWVGIPNKRPTNENRWLAMEVRAAAPRLRICRASCLAYNHFTWGQEVDFGEDRMDYLPVFDFDDPCGLGRGISQRFVEVVMGIEQPNTPKGDPVKYLSRREGHEALAHDLKPRTRALSVTEHDTNAHQMVFGNNTSKWHKTIDGVFPNCNQATLDELHRIAETAYRGLNEVHRYRDQHMQGSRGFMSIDMQLEEAALEVLGQTLISEGRGRDQNQDQDQDQEQNPE